MCRRRADRPGLPPTKTRESPTPVQFYASPATSTLHIRGSVVSGCPVHSEFRGKVTAIRTRGDRSSLGLRDLETKWSPKRYSKDTGVSRSRILQAPVGRRAAARMLPGGLSVRRVL